MKPITKMAVMASAMLTAGLEPGMYDPMPQKRVRQKKEFTHFDQERLDKAQEKRARKSAKYVRDNV